MEQTEFRAHSLAPSSCPGAGTGCPGCYRSSCSCREPALVVPAQGHPPACPCCSLPKDSPWPWLKGSAGITNSPLVRVHVSLAAAVPEEGYLSCCESRSCSSLQTKASSIYFSWELVHGVTCFALPQPVVCAEAAGTQNPVPSGEGSSPCSHSKYSHAHTKQSLGNSLASRTAEQTG